MIKVVLAAEALPGAALPEAAHPEVEEADHHLPFVLRVSPGRKKM